jgi:hypothetical protein
MSQNPSSQAETSVEEQAATLQVYAYAARQLGAGRSQRQVEDDLVAQGLEEYDARDVVSQLAKRRRASIRKAGIMKLVVGLVIMLAGAAATICSMASLLETGSFAIWYGAILVGLLQSVRGVIQLVSGREEPAKNSADSC